MLEWHLVIIRFSLRVALIRKSPLASICVRGCVGVSAHDWDVPFQKCVASIHLLLSGVDSAPSQHGKST